MFIVDQASALYLCINLYRKVESTVRELFDFVSPRTKEGLGELKDMFLWIQYLYINRKHNVKVWGQTIKMDSNFNLVYVMESMQPDGSFKEDFNHSICANSLTFKDLYEITEQLKSDKKTWDNIKLSVSACEILNVPRNIPT